ncbi:hypothetical protein FACS189499_06490 [Clostridia bacterium]|nr:hypothetical protein FACS189499_06490 [Clostridia bacterium]
MVDFENVHSEGISGIDKLGAEDEVVIFYSANADSISFELLHKLMFCESKLSYYKVKCGGKNALDFQLCTYLGYIVSRNPGAETYIISKDNGFDFVIDFWRSGYVDTAPEVHRFQNIKSVSAWIANGRTHQRTAPAIVAVKAPSPVTGSSVSAARPAFAAVPVSVTPVIAAPLPAPSAIAAVKPAPVVKPAPSVRTVPGAIDISSISDISELETISSKKEIAPVHAHITRAKKIPPRTAAGNTEKAVAAITGIVTEKTVVPAAKHDAKLDRVPAVKLERTTKSEVKIEPKIEPKIDIAPAKPAARTRKAAVSATKDTPKIVEIAETPDADVPPKKRTRGPGKAKTAKTAKAETVFDTSNQPPLTEDEYNRAKELVFSSKNKQEFYANSMREFKQARGREVYRVVRSEFTKLKKEQENGS